LAVERTRPGPGAARRARALARLHRSIAMGESPAGDPHHGAARVEPPEAAANPPAPPPDVRPIPHDQGLGSRNWLGLGCFLLGVAMGAGGLAGWQVLRAGHAPAIVAAAPPAGGGAAPGSPPPPPPPHPRPRLELNPADPTPRRGAATREQPRWVAAPDSRRSAASSTRRE